MRFFLRDGRAQVGVGVLLIFLSMVLVSVLAAVVVMRTFSIVESQATITGGEASKEVVTALRVPEVIGYSSDKYRITSIGLTVELAPGSENIRYDNILLAYHSGDVYLSGILHELAPNAGENNFSVTFIRNKTSDYVLEHGETAQLWFNLEENPKVEPLLPGEEFSITVIPVGGQVIEITKYVPKGLNQRYVVEW